MSNIIYIYSKYSKFCNQLDDIITKIDNINTLCIDNPIARKRIESNHNLSINKVPTVIVNSEDIKIYEGDIAHKFLVDIYNNMFPQENPNTQQQEIQQQEIQQQEIQQEKIQVNTSEVSSIQDVLDEDTHTNIQDVLEEQERVSNTSEIINEQVNKKDEKEDLMSKVEQLQKNRELMIASESNEEKLAKS